MAGGCNCFMIFEVSSNRKQSEMSEMLQVFGHCTCSGQGRYSCIQEMYSSVQLGKRHEKKLIIAGHH